MDSCLFEILIPPRQTVPSGTGFVLLTTAGDSTHQVQHMEFGYEMTLQMGDVPEPLGVL